MQILHYRRDTSISFTQYPLITLPTSDSIVQFVTSNMYDNTSIPLINDNFLVMGDTRLYNSNTAGVGTISGNTYLNDKPDTYECTVILYNNNIEIDRVHTNDGQFKFTHLNSNLMYELRAIPIDNKHNPKIISDVTPVIDNDNYNLKLYAVYYDYYANVNSKLQLAVQGNRSDELIFNIEGDTADMTVNSSGLIEFITTTSGIRNITATVSDPILQLTESFQLSINIIYTERRFIPLTNDTNDHYTGEVLTVNGNIPTYNMMRKFIDGAYISSTTPLKFDKDFYMSFKFIKYNLNSANNYYATLISAGVTLSDDISYLILFGAGHRDAGKLVYRVNKGDKLISNTVINEYQEYKVVIKRVDNLVSMYIDDELDVSVNLDSTMLVNYEQPTVSPIRIGTNIWDDGDKKGGFGGLISNFEYMYNYSESTLNENIKYNPSPINYELHINSNNISTTYGELPVESTASILDDRLVFTGSEHISFEPNSVNRLTYSNINLYINFECDTIDDTMQCLVDSLSSNASTGFGIFINSSGVYIHTDSSDTSTLTTFPFQLLEHTYNTLCVSIVDNVLSVTLNNNTISTSSNISTTTNNSTFTIGNVVNASIDEVVPFTGYIDKLQITNDTSIAS